jgi:phosphopantothenoylcysteine decarboxylase
MSSFGSDTGDVLYLVVCAAPPARDAVSLVGDLRQLGWDVSVVITRMAEPWVEAEAVARASGHPVRRRFRAPDAPPFQPLGDAVLVAPATFNTINQAAAGINDSLALGLINEALGHPVPLAFVPCVGDALAAHPAFLASVQLLAAAGALFLPGLAPSEVASAADHALRSRRPG